MFKIIYTGQDSKKIRKEVLRAFDFLSNYFTIKVPDIIVRIYENRTEFDKNLKRKTADWFVANASRDKEIDILSPWAMASESSHDKEEFLPILKHEFTHLFVQGLAKGSAVPMWLNEGLASYVAKQHQSEKQTIYIEEHFCEKLSTPKSWDKYVNYSVYSVASLFVHFLIKKYSFKKIKELIASLDKNYYYPGFKKIFSQVYKKDLSELEILFIKEINK
ncbi:MAG: hypothetical protein WC249_04235 [Patescibacteria group bacterium]|jgi:hypothetical protein